MAGTIAAELARYRINVNVIEPGWIDTPGEHEDVRRRRPSARPARSSPGGGWACPRTSARRPPSSPPTTPTISPAPHSWSTAVFFSASRSLEERDDQPDARFPPAMAGRRPSDTPRARRDASPLPPRRGRTWSSSSPTTSGIPTSAAMAVRSRPRTSTPWRRAACGSRSSTTPRGAGRRVPRC